ncbi:MAG: methenyltetrahydromethanopterin cyclohydrolase [Gammaproteobacteria bacterium]
MNVRFAESSNFGNQLPSVNALSAPLVRQLIDDALALRLDVRKLANGTRTIDAGIDSLGGLEAGRRIAEICLGGLGKVSFRAAGRFQRWTWHIDVHTANPVIACLGSQYAGWSLSHGEGKGSFHALGSGPARALGSNEDLFQELGYRDQSDSTCLVLEVSQVPPVEVAEKVAAKCGLEPSHLTLILTPTTSLAGSVQVVARCLEVALHKVHALGFPLDRVADGLASAPVCPTSQDLITAMGRSNDAILFGGEAHLFVHSDDLEAKDLAERLPSTASRDYGRPFAEVFKDYGYDFYKIDPMLFSPARVAVTSLKTGHTFHAGALNEELLEKSFA